jgi:hypothetical protein
LERGELGWYVGPAFLLDFALLGVAAELICLSPEHAEQQTSRTRLSV